jgi:prevent-host-death family protein
MRSWKLQDAKARFSEVVKDATNDGPQEITLRGVATVVVISKTEYDKLLKPKPSFLEFMRHSPLVNANILIKRDPSLNREIDL